MGVCSVKRPGHVPDHAHIGPLAALRAKSTTGSTLRPGLHSAKLLRSVKAARKFPARLHALHPIICCQASVHVTPGAHPASLEVSASALQVNNRFKLPLDLHFATRRMNLSGRLPVSRPPARCARTHLSRTQHPCAHPLPTSRPFSARATNCADSSRLTATSLAISLAAASTCRTHSTRSMQHRTSARRHVHACREGSPG